MRAPTFLSSGAVALGLAAGCETGSLPSGDTGATSDGGADTAVFDTGVAYPGYRGELTVGAGLQGVEEFYYYGLVDAADVCVVRSDLSATAASSLLCDGCEWAYDITSSGSVVVEDAYCSSLDAGALDDQTFTYGYSPDYYGYPYLMYYSTYAATWYGLTADVSVDGATYTYDWALDYLSYGYYR